MISAERVDAGNPQRAPRGSNDREPRRNVDLAGFASLDDGTTFAISVVDLSYKGCRIATPIALMPGLKMTFSIGGANRPMAATVRWYKDGLAGLQFVLPEIAEKQAPRRDQRIELSTAVSLRRLGRQPYQARLFDLTPGGCKVEFIERPLAGDIVWVKFDGLDGIEASVRWMDGYYGGLEFTRPIYPAVFDLLVARLNASVN